VTETEIEDFWQKHPCGDAQVGGLARHQDYESFFQAYDQFRYATEAHIPACLDQIDFRGKRVLEIGLGEGAESEQIIRRGGIWSGLDLTAESISRVKARLTLRKLPYEDLKQGSAVSIPYDSKRFDIVFSHGVLHHIPEIQRVQKEIHRVLKSDGQLIAMLYARWSLNYLLAISIARRLGLIALYVMRYNPGGIYGQHLESARTTGLFRYLRMSHFIHRNTDGPLNPYSKVYDLKTVRADFPDFEVVHAFKRLMHAPPLPVGKLPLARLLGWHLWVHLKPKS
jgi:SAM-dependent methyltransferase